MTLDIKVRSLVAMKKIKGEELNKPISQSNESVKNNITSESNWSTKCENSTSSNNEEFSISNTKETFYSKGNCNSENETLNCSKNNEINESSIGFVSTNSCVSPKTMNGGVLTVKKLESDELQFKQVLLLLLIVLVLMVNQESFIKLVTPLYLSYCIYLLPKYLIELKDFIFSFFKQE